MCQLCPEYTYADLYNQSYDSNLLIDEWIQEKIESPSCLKCRQRLLQNLLRAMQTQTSFAAANDELKSTVRREHRRIGRQIRKQLLLLQHRIALHVWRPTSQLVLRDAKQVLSQLAALRCSSQFR